MARKRHPKASVEAAIRYAETHDWTYVEAGGSAHAWGFLRCTDTCPQLSVWSTPRSPENHARQIRRAVDRCPH